MQQNRKQSNLNRYSKLLGILMLGIAEIAMARDIGEVATGVSGSFNAWPSRRRLFSRFAAFA